MQEYYNNIKEAIIYKYSDKKVKNTEFNSDFIKLNNKISNFRKLSSWIQYAAMEVEQ